MSKPTQTPQITQEQAEQQLNQLVSEIRLLESYYNEIVQRIQQASTGLGEARSAIQSIDALVQNTNGEFLMPVGGGLFLPVSNVEAKKLIMSVGADVAIEKDLDSAKTFLLAREKELEAAMNSLEKQRREIGSRLENGRSLLEKITGQS